MATFNAYVSTNGTNYQMVLSEVDVTGISGNQEASVRILERDASTTHLSLAGLDLDLRNSDTYLPGGNVFHTTITETQYNTISEVTAYERVDSGNTIRYIYEDQVELFLGPTFEDNIITNTDSSTLPYIATGDILNVDNDGTYEYRVTDHTDNTGVTCEVIDINDGPIARDIQAPPNFNAGSTFNITIDGADEDGTIQTVSLTSNGVEVLTSAQMTNFITNGTLTISDFSPATATNQVLVLTITDDRNHTATTTHTVNVNTTTLTIMFVDMTSTDVTLSSTTQFQMTGIPGEAIPDFSRRVSVGSGFILDTPSFTETGDAGNNVTASFGTATRDTTSQRQDLNITGTYPTSDTTVVLTITSTATAKAAGSCSLSIGSVNSSGCVANVAGSPSWSFGISMTPDGFEQGDAQIWISSPTSFRSFPAAGNGRRSVSASGTSSTSLVIGWSGGTGSPESYSASISTPETLTIASCSRSTSGTI